jgi:nitrogen regulatory protein PII
MVTTYLKKRIDIIVEAPVLNRLLDKLDKVAVTGYTVLPALAGRGSEGSWRGENLVGDAGHMVVVMCVTSADKVDQVLEAAYSILSRQIGIVTVSDVQVIRSEHF